MRLVVVSNHHKTTTHNIISTHKKSTQPKKNSYGNMTMQNARPTGLSGTEESPEESANRIAHLSIIKTRLWRRGILLTSESLLRTTYTSTHCSNEWSR